MFQKLAILLCCTYTLASEHSGHSQHTIPIEHYETELQNLGEHVEIPEHPVKVIKITKTIAVKVPVPYPVKVVQKVPYPVHISKPYPVPVPQIVHVPAPHKPHAHDASDGHQQQDQPYQVQESPSYGPSNGEHSFESYNGNSDHGNFEANGDGHSDGSSGNSHDLPNTYYGYSGDKSQGSDDSKSYDNVIKEYFQKYQPSGHNQNSGSYNYH